ncbi:MAG TPA: RDD family protein [Candidatus Caenarcaniphilales bacterium]
MLEPIYNRLPKAGVWQRGYALSIDFAVVWLVSAILSANQIVVQSFVFGLAWFGLRVVLVVNNQGQSLGRWALDMKVVEAKLGKKPGFLELSKREGIVGLGALLTIIGLSNLSRNATAVLLIIPLAVDCAVALTEPIRRQAFHDRLANTLVIYTHRGYSLDRKVRKLFAQVRRRVR